MEGGQLMSKKSLKQMLEEKQEQRGISALTIADDDVLTVVKEWLDQTRKELMNPKITCRTNVYNAGKAFLIHELLRSIDQ